MKATPELAFGYLREKIEAVGVFVLLIGNLGSHHTAIDAELSEDFALAGRNRAVCCCERPRC